MGNTKIFIVKIFVALFCILATEQPLLATDLKPGDIVFHTSQSSQSKAIQLAMNSPYSHMGLVLFRDQKPYVFEASKVVRFTPLEDWIALGVGKKYVVKRVRDTALLDDVAIEKLYLEALKFEGKPYDLYFEWSDERIYCSELVWKIYKEAIGIEIGEFQQLQDFELSHPHVRAKLRERFGDSIPLNEQVISPAAMFESPLLKTVER